MNCGGGGGGVGDGVGDGVGATDEAAEAGAEYAASGQGLTLVHFSAQPQPFLT